MPGVQLTREAQAHGFAKKQQRSPASKTTKSAMSQTNSPDFLWPRRQHPTSAAARVAGPRPPRAWPAPPPLVPRCSRPAPAPPAAARPPRRLARQVGPEADTCAHRTAEVCKAFESELGVTLPMKYFDPLGMAKDGTFHVCNRAEPAGLQSNYAPPRTTIPLTSAAAEWPRSRTVPQRESETVIIRPMPCARLGRVMPCARLGRVAMLACMGYIAPEYFRLPGLCSPSKGKLPQSLQLIMLRRISISSCQYISRMIEGGLIQHRSHSSAETCRPAYLRSTLVSLSGVAFADIPNGVQALYKMPAEARCTRALLFRSGFVCVYH